MIFYLSSLTLPPSPEFLQLRIYQRGGKEWKKFEYPSVGGSLEVNFPIIGDPVIVLWVVQGEKVTPRDTVEGWGTVATRGFAEVDLVPGTEKTFSIRDPAANYEDYGTRMKITVPNGKPVRAVTPIGALLTDAEMERKEYDETVSLGRALAPVISIMFLRRFRSVSGILPASYFCMVGFYDPPPEEAMVSQMLSNASELHGWSYSSTLEMLRRFRKDSTVPQLPKLLEIVGDMLVLPATANYYHGDHSLERVVDRFQSSIYQDMGQGDCEDVAKDIHYFGTSIQKLDPDRGVLKDLVWLLQMYTFMILTGVATSPKLQRPGTIDHGENPEDYICHVWTSVVPHSRVSLWKNIPAVTSKHMDRLVSVGALLLEGTNFTTSLHRPLTSYYADRTVLKEMAQDKWKKTAIRMGLPADLKDLPYPIPAIPTLESPTSPGEQSRFYRYVVSAWTHPLSDSDPIEHTFTRRGTFGVSLQDFLSLPPDIVMRPNFKRRLTTRGIMALLGAEPPQKPLLSRPPADLPSLHGVSFDAKPEASEDFPYTTPWLSFRLQNQNELTKDVAVAFETFRKEHTGTKVAVTILPVTSSFSLIQVDLYLSDSVRAEPVQVNRARELSP